MTKPQQKSQQKSQQQPQQQPQQQTHPSPAPNPALDDTQDSISLRQLWANNRFWMESENRKSKRYGGKSHHHWYLLLYLMKLFQLSLKLTGTYRAGVQNANNIVLREISIKIPTLPPSFDGFTLLQLSDLHLDGMPGLEHKILQIIDQRSVDLAILTGDYRTELHGPIGAIMNSLQTLVNGIKTRHGFLGILGNHDDVHMVSPMEKMGINMLLNENHLIEKEGDILQFIGTDDVHYYYTDLAIHAMEKAREHCTIALVHSAELYDVAAECGAKLYLCGHTHGGQVCLPNGRPIITHLNRGKAFYRGHWHYKNMQGITNTGAGTSGIPVRFNTQGEVLIIKLLSPAN